MADIPSTIPFPDPVDVPTSPTVTPPTPDPGTPFEFTSPFVDRPNSFYHEVGYQMTTIWDMGLRGSPLAGPAASMSVFWRQQGISAMRVCTWVVSCAGAVPQVPHWDLDDNGNSVLLGKAISADVPQQMADGFEIFFVVGQYVWRLQKAPEDSDPIVIPASLVRVDTSKKLLNPGDFLRYLIGPIPAPSGYSGYPVTY